MGAAPELIVPDNPRAVIAVPDRYEPRVGDTVLDFARHYGCSVLPARPHTPQDKANVESAGRRALDPRAASPYAPGQLGARHSRASVFAAIDAPAMGTLPATRYEYARFKTVRVNVDYHVEIEGHRYSVPHALVGQQLDARMTATAIELLHRGNRVVGRHEQISPPSPVGFFAFHQYGKNTAYRYSIKPP